MARRNISLPDDLDERARSARVNVSALARRAVAEELDRQSRMGRLDAWLDALDGAHGAPSAAAIAEAEAWFASAERLPARGSALQAVPPKAPRKGQRAAG